MNFIIAVPSPITNPTGIITTKHKIVANIDKIISNGSNKTIAIARSKGSFISLG